MIECTFPGGFSSTIKDECAFPGSDSNTIKEPSDTQIVGPSQKPDMVNHPRHYNREDAMECIDEMEMIYGIEATMYFCLLSAHKYRYRAGLKNDGFEDIRKSDWYMQKTKELKEKLSQN